MATLELPRSAKALRSMPTSLLPKRRREPARALQADLSRRVSGEVRFDKGTRAIYATDLSIYRHVPIGVVIPRDESDVIAAVATCREHDAPILGRGCGTSLAGQTCNVAVVLDFSKYMNRLISLDPEAKTAIVQPGLINDQLREAAKAHGLTFAPDPATHKYCTLGGNIGNNSCGAHTVMGGKTVDNVEALDVLTYDGTRMTVGATDEARYAQVLERGGRPAEIYRRLRALADRYGDEIRRRYPHIPRRVSGYNLDDLLPEKGFHLARALVGSESTCALTLRAQLRLLDFPPARALVVLAYDDCPSAADEVPQIRDLQPTALEAFQRHVIDNLRTLGKEVRGARLLPEAGAYLVVEFAGEDQAAANAAAERARERLKHMRSKARDVRLFEKEEDQTAVWEVREAGVASSHVPFQEEAWPSWEDSAVPPDRLGDYLREFEKLNHRYGYAYTLFGHFGDGCVHARMTFGLRTPEGVRRFRAYMQEAADLCVSFGGSLSGEHGDGQARAELLPKMFGADLIGAFHEFKSIWDPDWRMNPGKIVDPRPLDADLRLGPAYHPEPVRTEFSFAADDGSFSHAAERCFGVGLCRALGGQTMCPSFQATREEMHSTRGRAHMLFEMMRGETLRDGWRSEAVREALDLCLQCKGCKHDCPASVDMATYKAEFLSHYYKGRLRPREAYSMGLIFLWARLAMLAPGLVNTLLRAPVLGRAVKLAAGFAPQRPAPEFAPRSFQSWWRRRPRQSHARTVVLWPDTFNNHFLPGTLKAAATVLESAGYQVEVPSEPVCCGRPLYDYGMLDLARTRLEHVLKVLRPAIRAGAPVIGLEPSCISVFRDELLDLMPDDPDAQALARQAKSLGEFLASDPDWRPPALEGEALLHQHCHQKSVLDADAERRALEALGLKIETPAAGCCGQAGSFGYEPGHFEVSMKIGEQVLLPKVREAPEGRLVIADGFSCRQQIRDGTGRWAMHPAEVLALALDGSVGEAEKRRYLEPPARPGLATVALAIGSAAILAGAVAAGRAARR